MLEGAEQMLMAHPAVLRDLIEKYETLALLEAQQGSGRARSRNG